MSSDEAYTPYEITFVGMMFMPLTLTDAFMMTNAAIAVAGGEAPLTQKSYMRPMLMRHTDCSTSTVVGLVDLRLE